MQNRSVSGKRFPLQEQVLEEHSPLVKPEPRTLEQAVLHAPRNLTKTTGTLRRLLYGRHSLAARRSQLWTAAIPDYVYMAVTDIGVVMAPCTLNERKR